MLVYLFHFLVILFHFFVIEALHHLIASNLIFLLRFD